MFTKPSYLSVFLASGSARKVDGEQDWRIHAVAPCVHVLIGVVCALLALPFDLRAAALAPVAVGFAKGLFDHYAKNDANPANFAWIIAGAAMAVGFVKLAGSA